MLVACGGVPREAVTARAPRWTRLPSGTSESLRGLSIPSREVVWASGAHGAVLRSIDGGASWASRAIEGTAALDFRSLHAFDADRAVVLSAGNPARAFVTTTGGQSWMEAYTRVEEGVFFDSLAFDGDEGLALGDPMPSPEGPRFAIVRTHDGGRTWVDGTGPLAEPGEAAFAASNGCIALLTDGTTLFATSGSRVLRSSGEGAWTSAAVPIPGSPSAGTFAIAFRDVRVGYAVGGDYAAPSAPGSFARTGDGGASWSAGAAPRGYRSSIAVAGRALLVVGTSGTDVSYDEGASWQPVDDLPLNAVRVVGDVAFAVGPDGTIATLTAGAGGR